MKKTLTDLEEINKNKKQRTKKIPQKKVLAFQKQILDFYNSPENEKRHSLPWRKKSRTAYQVLISEVMLQQTQVDRVIPFFKKWLTSFPNFKKLASASTHDVLSHWKGLGYNSRALRLQKLAQIVTQEHRGRLPSDCEDLLELPGIGPYTAAAVSAFAYDKAHEMIETNIRRVYIHHFYTIDQAGIPDQEILDLVAQTIPKKHEEKSRKKMGRKTENIKPSIWFWALMDYGSTLPKIIKKNPNTQSKKYIKQSAFARSDRQVRGAILEVLLREEYKKSGIVEKRLFKEVKKLVGYDLEELRFDSIAQKIEREGFVVFDKKKGVWMIKK